MLIPPLRATNVLDTISVFLTTLTFWRGGIIFVRIMIITDLLLCCWRPFTLEISVEGSHIESGLSETGNLLLSGFVLGLLHEERLIFLVDSYKKHEIRDILLTGSNGSVEKCSSPKRIHLDQRTGLYDPRELEPFLQDVVDVRLDQISL
jgi:hypothetical protein